MSETWLQKLIASHDISKDTYTEIFNTVSSTRSDMAEKCEQLELLFCDLDETERETLVRKVLELLDERGIDSLLNPENHSQNLRKQKETSTIESKDFDENLEKYIISHIDTMDLNQTEDSKELEPIELLHSIFSDVGVEKLHYSLASCNYDIEKTIQYLLGDKPEQEPVSKQICRHFMAGECYRSDCWFSHNIDALVCKFWLSGSCYKGDKCEFSHGQNLGEISKLRRQSESSSARSSATSRATEPPKLEDFPQLGNVPKPKINFLSPTKPFNATLKAAKPTQSPTLERKVASMQSNYGREKLDMKWVSTGNTLNTSYITHRQDAINCAVERNKLFQKATEAYLNGNKAAAANFSKLANNLNTQLKSLNQSASRRIFDQRNYNSSSSEPIIDLHGLHPEEAIDILNEKVRKFSASGFRGKIVIITGTGHHSRGQSKLLPSVRTYLQSAGYKPRDATVRDGRGGILTIEI